MKKLIRKVWKRKGTGKKPQKLITIPQDSKIEVGDLVRVIKVK